MGYPSFFCAGETREKNFDSTPQNNVNMFIL
jgi:hypothetical protein